MSIAGVQDWQARVEQRLAAIEAGLLPCDRIVLRGTGSNPGGIIYAPGATNPATAPSLLLDATGTAGDQPLPFYRYYPSGFAAGGAASLVWRVNVTPTGTIDASNADFTLPSLPATGSLILVLNGVVQLLDGTGIDGYTLSGATITYVRAPGYGASSLTHFWHRAWYLEA